MKSLKTEVLVIGAGPAGTVASSILKRRGREVMVLEGGMFPRFQIGESLLPRSIDILDEAGLLSAVQARSYIVKQGAQFLRGKETDRFAFAEMFPGQRPQTYQVPRGDFDQTLATAALAMGVDLRFGQRMDAIEVAARRGEPARARCTDVESGESYDVTAQWVLDCSGFGRVLPRLLKLERPSVLSQRKALFTHVEKDLRPQGPTEGDIWVCLHPRGAWIWIIPFSNGRTSVGVVAPEQMFVDAPGRCDRDKLFALIQEDPNARERLKHAVPVMETKKLEAWSAAVDKFHGPGWALTGNAGEFLDPIFSSGVTLAVETSAQAARLVDRELKGEAVDWDKEFVGLIDKAVGTFKVFVQSWYANELPKLLLSPQKTPQIKRAITSVLGGYVTDDANPFVRNGRATLDALLKLA